MDNTKNIKPHIQTLFNLIESNLCGDFNIESIANAGHVSAKQLYRDFYNLTGHTVKEYIRKRRLSHALSLIIHSDFSLVDIAYNCGYGSQQAFCKKVKTVTGLTPLEYKASGGYFYFPPFSNENTYQVIVMTETLPEMIRLKYFHNCMRGIENLAVAHLFSVFPEYKGRIFGRSGKQNRNQFCYELFIEGNDNMIEALKESEFSGLEKIEGDKCVFAKTQCKNNEDEINAAWDYIYSDWLKTSMFEQTNDPYFEEYIVKNGKIKRLVLFLPVKRRGDYYKIHIENCLEALFLVSRKTGSNAEDDASRAVIDYLISAHPYISLKNADYYVAANGLEYTCGVGINKPFVLPINSGLEILKIKQGEYAVLESDSLGRTSVYENILRSWMNDMGLKSDKIPQCTMLLKNYQKSVFEV
jgi:AraC-like DNA-binding protein/predicted transcriptional regulator YdeE